MGFSHTAMIFSADKSASEYPHCRESRERQSSRRCEADGNKILSHEIVSRDEYAGIEESAVQQRRVEKARQLADNGELALRVSVAAESEVRCGQLAAQRSLIKLFGRAIQQPHAGKVRQSCAPEKRLPETPNHRRQGEIAFRRAFPCIVSLPRQ